MTDESILILFFMEIEISKGEEQTGSMVCMNLDLD